MRKFVLSALVCCVVAGTSSFANAGIFHRHGGCDAAPVCCEPAPVVVGCCDVDPCASNRGHHRLLKGLFSKMKSKSCCDMAPTTCCDAAPMMAAPCCAPAPVMAAPCCETIVEPCCDVDPCCAPKKRHRPLRDLIAKLHARKSRCCAPVVDSCCDVAPSCGCASAPACGCGM